MKSFERFELELNTWYFQHKICC